MRVVKNEVDHDKCEGGDSACTKETWTDSSLVGVFTHRMCILLDYFFRPGLYSFALLRTSNSCGSNTRRNRSFKKKGEEKSNRRNVEKKTSNDVKLLTKKERAKDRSEEISWAILICRCT